MLAITGACSTNDSEAQNADTAVISIEQALSSEHGTELSVDGFLVVEDDGQSRLCEMLLESLPPQCGGDRIQLSEFDISEVPGVQYVQGSSEIDTTAWTNEFIAVMGIRNSEGLGDVSLQSN